jgi:hypothetical protein
LCNERRKSGFGGAAARPFTAVSIAAGLAQFRRVNADEADIFVTGSHRVTVDNVHTRHHAGRGGLAPEGLCGNRTGND